MGRFIRRPSPGTVIATIALFIALGGIAAALPGSNTVNNGDVRDLTWRSLDLKNGWEQYDADNARAKVAIDAQGVVHLRGAISQNTALTNNNPFRLPAKYRPSRYVYVPVDMCDATNGRLFINNDPAGQTYVQSEGPFDNAQCFTSLEGVTFSKK